MTRRDTVAESSIMPVQNMFSASQRETSTTAIPVGWDKPHVRQCDCRAAGIAL